MLAKDNKVRLLGVGSEGGGEDSYIKRQGCSYEKLN